MKRASIIKHKGATIHYINFSNLKSLEEIKEALSEGSKDIRLQAPKTVLSLINLENIFFNTKIAKAFSDVVKLNSPYVRASAIIGVSGLTKVMINGVVKLTGRDLPTFSSIEEAKDHLSSK